MRVCVFVVFTERSNQRTVKMLYTQTLYPRLLRLARFYQLIFCNWSQHVLVDLRIDREICESFFLLLWLLLLLFGFTDEKKWDKVENSDFKTALIFTHLILRIVETVPKWFSVYEIGCEWWVWLWFVQCASVQWMEARCAEGTLMVDIQHSCYTTSTFVIQWLEWKLKLLVLESFNEEC